MFTMMNMPLKAFTIKIPARLFCSIILFAGYSTTLVAQSTDEKGLKDYYKNFFPVGVAVSPQSIKNKDQADFIISQFNSITPENAMKMGPIHPAEDRYNWR